MVIDYRTKKPVGKNRPKKQPVSIFLFSLFVAVLISYTLGLLTGWLVFRPESAQVTESQNGLPVTGAKNGKPSPQVNEGAAPENNTNVKEPMLTFYDTLPKGSRELIGSGLNLPKPVVTLPTKEAPQQKPENQAKPSLATAPTVQDKEESNRQAKASEAQMPKEKPAKEQATKQEEPKVRYTVQVASYHEKKEAEDLRDRLKGNGLAAYLVESRIPEKGIFYRVRVGRHLEQKGAQELVGKIGMGAIVIPE